jgi:hypothetical protein
MRREFPNRGYAIDKVPPHFFSLHSSSPGLHFIHAFAASREISPSLHRQKENIICIYFVNY